MSKLFSMNKPPPFYKHGGVVSHHRRHHQHFNKVDLTTNQTIPHGSLPSMYHLVMGNLNSPSANLLYPQITK